MFIEVCLFHNFLNISILSMLATKSRWHSYHRAETHGGKQHCSYFLKPPSTDVCTEMPSIPSLCKVQNCQSEILNRTAVLLLWNSLVRDIKSRKPMATVQAWLLLGLVSKANWCLSLQLALVANPNICTTSRSQVWTVVN